MSGPRAPRAAAVGASSGGFGGWARRCLPPILRRCITRQLRQAHWAARMSPRGARALNAGDAVSLTHAMERVVAGPCCPPPCSSSAAAAWAGAVAGPVQKLVRWRTSWLSVGNTMRQSGHLICAGRCVSAAESTTKGRHGLKIKAGALPPDQPRFVWPLAAASAPPCPIRSSSRLCGLAGPGPALPSEARLQHSSKKHPLKSVESLKSSFDPICRRRTATMVTGVLEPSR